MPFGEEKGEAEDWLRYTGARHPWISVGWFDTACPPQHSLHFLHDCEDMCASSLHACLLPRRAPSALVVVTSTHIYENGPGVLHVTRSKRSVMNRPKREIGLVSGTAGFLSLVVMARCMVGRVGFLSFRNSLWVLEH